MNFTVFYNLYISQVIESLRISIIKNYTEHAQSLQMKTYHFKDNSFKDNINMKYWLSVLKLVLGVIQPLIL